MLQKNGKIYYIVRFEDGAYYKGFSYADDGDGITYNINDARLYTFDWQIHKDFYFMLHLDKNNIDSEGYEILKIRSQRINTIIKE